MRKLTAFLAVCVVLFVAAPAVRGQAGTPPGSYSPGAASGLATNTPGIPSLNGTVYYPTNYGVKADTQSVFDGVCSNTSNIVTSASAHFKTGAKIRVGETFWALAGGGTGSGPNDLAIAKTTVLSIDSDTQIHTTANGNANCGSSMALVWGDDDTAALNATWAAANGTFGCGSIVLPSGQMMISGGVMNTPLSPTCNGDVQSDNMTIIGSGFQSTIFVPTPDFDLTTCTGGAKQGCIGPGPVGIHDVQVNGFGLSSTTVSTTTASVFGMSSPGIFTNIFCQFFAPFDANLTGFSQGAAPLLYAQNVWSQACGAIGPSYNGGGSVMGSFLTPSQGNPPSVASGTPGTDFFNTWISASPVNECAFIFSGFAHAFGQFGATNAEICGQAGANFTLDSAVIAHNQGIAGRAALKLTGGAIGKATNSTFNDPGAGEFSVSVDATSSFTDGCGNTYTGAINVASGGKFIPCSGQAYPTGSTLQLAAITGTGACAAPSTVKGNILAGSAVCPGTTGASTFIVTPGITAPNGWNCQGTYDSTTYAVPTALTFTATACTATFTSVTANDVISFKVSPF